MASFTTLICLSLLLATYFGASEGMYGVPQQPPQPQQQQQGRNTGYGAGYPSTNPSQLQSQLSQNSFQNGAAHPYGQTSPTAQAKTQQPSPSWTQNLNYNGQASGLPTQQFQQIVQLLKQITQMLNLLQYSQSINPFQSEYSMTGSGYGNFGSPNSVPSNSFGSARLNSVTGDPSTQSLNSLTSSSFGTEGLNSLNGDPTAQQQLWQQQMRQAAPPVAINF